MGQHDWYGKQLLREVAGQAFEDSGQSVQVDFGAGPRGQLDGVVNGSIAVEIEARVPKQIRGAIIDLIFHACTKKLLVILPVNVSNPEVTATQCREILGRFTASQDFRVVVTRGSGHEAHVEEDSRLVAGALRDLGFHPPGRSQEAEGRVRMGVQK